jgi:hypothetical protein
MLSQSSSRSRHAQLHCLLCRFDNFQYLPSVIDPEVDRLLDEVPELADRYLALAEAADGDPGAAAAFGELGELVAEIAAQLARLEPVLIRVLGAVEQVASSSEDAEELVGGAFLDSLTPDDLRRLEPWLGPATRAVADDLDLPLERDEGRP